VGHFTWVLNADKSDATENKLRSILDERIGDVVTCDFVYVDDVPVLASGKRQFFVNEIEDPITFIAERTGGGASGR
jgi:phenylacetate-CoA ligase